MKNKKHLLISIIVHAAVIGLIVFIPSCPRKQEVEIIENVKIVPQAPSVEVKQPEPEEPVKKPEPKPEPELVKKKRTVPKYTPDELKKRLEEKLKETPEEPEKPVKTPEAQSSKTEIRSVLKENWYLALLKSKIENSWQQPSRVLLSGRDALKLTVGFTLQQNGTVANVRVIKSSGVAVVDISSVNAVKNAAPFPPAPEGSGSKPIDISIDFILKE